MNERQFRFVDGTEIICEVVDEDEDEIVIRYALKVEKVDMSFSVSYYTFKTWMVYQSKAEDLISINPYHILGVTHPKDEVLSQYYKTLELINSEEEDPDEDPDSIESLLNKMKDHLDSDHSNVISLVDRGKLH